MCLDYLGTILAAVVARNFPPLGLLHEGRLRVLTIRPDFTALVNEAFDQIRCGAGGNVAIMERMTATIDMIGTMATLPERIRALLQQLDLMEELNAQTVAAPVARISVQRQVDMVRARLPVSAPTAALASPPLCETDLPEAGRR